MKNTLKVKNLHRTGKAVVNSTYGDVNLEVYKQKGGKIYKVKVDGFCKGISRRTPFECWKWLSVYLSIPLSTTELK